MYDLDWCWCVNGTTRRFSAIDSKYVKPGNARPRGWSLLNLCQSLREKDPNETLQSSACFSQPDVLGQASSSLAQLFSTSVLRLHLGFDSWRRFVYCALTVTFSAANNFYLMRRIDSRIIVTHFQCWVVYF